MWISRKKYNHLCEMVAVQDKLLVKYIKQNAKLKHDINLLKNINSPVDVIFPNTDERGLNGDSGSPTIPEIFEM